MKIKLLFICLLFIFSVKQSEAQIGKGKLGDMFKKSKKKAERKVEKRVEKKIDDTIDEKLEEVMTPKEKEDLEAANKAKETLADQAKRLEVMLKEGGADSPYLGIDLKKFRQNLDDYTKAYPKTDFSSEENFYADFSKRYEDLVAKEEKD